MLFILWLLSLKFIESQKYKWDLFIAFLYIFNVMLRNQEMYLQYKNVF